MIARGTPEVGRLLLATILAASGGTAEALATPLAYVANYSSDNVLVIDVTANTVVDTIDVGRSPLGVAVGPGGGRIYVTNQTSNTVSVIDGALNGVVDTVDVGDGPSGIAVKAPGTKVYVANRFDKTVTVIDTTTNDVLTTIDVEVGPAGIAVNPAGTPAYVVNKGSGSVSVIDTNTDAVIDTIPVGQNPSHVAFNPSGTLAYVTNGIIGTVSVIDTSTNDVIETFGVGNDPEGVAFDPTGARAFVVNYGPGNVSLIDAINHDVTGTVSVGLNPFDVAVAPNGNAFVTNRGGTSVSVIDGGTEMVTTTIDAEQGPVGFGEFIAPALLPPRFSKAARACQTAIARQAAKFARTNLGEQSSCKNRRLAARAAGTGMQQAEASCALRLNLEDPRSRVAQARAAAESSILRKCAGLDPIDVNDPCEGGETFPAVSTCVLSRHVTAVAEMADAEFGRNTQLLLGKRERTCQAALASNGRRFATRLQGELVGCLNGILKAGAGQKGVAAAFARCRQRLSPAEPHSVTVQERNAAAAKIARKCVGVTPAAIGDPCLANAASIPATASCILDQHLGRVAKMTAAQFNDACSMLTAVGLGTTFPDACTGP